MKNTLPENKRRKKPGPKSKEKTTSKAQNAQRGLVH
jgi:hypothetical protein